MRKIIPGLVVALTLTQMAEATAEEIKLVTGNDFIPYTEQSLPEGGVFTFIVKSLYQSADIEVSIDFRPWARGYNELTSGKYTATFPYIWTEERAREVLYSDPVSTETSIFLSPKSNLFSSATEIDNLDGATICIPVGYANNTQVQQKLDQGKFYSFSAPSLSDCLKLLLKGRADILDINEKVGRNSIRVAGLSQADFHTSGFSSSAYDYHVIFTKTDANAEKYRLRFNQILAKARQDGTLEKLEKSYVEKYLN